jgi:hypothetical protein
LGNPYGRKGKVALLSFIRDGNNANTKEKTLSMKLPNTYGMLGYYKTLTPYVVIYNFPLPVVLLYYGTKYNNKEWNPFSF